MGANPAGRAVTGEDRWRKAWRSPMLRRPEGPTTTKMNKILPPQTSVLVQKDDVVQAFPAEGADQAFDHWILPRGARRNELLLQA